jgi:bifunctional non-homologous end joining protein LigD
VALRHSTIPLGYIVFDVLRVDGHDLTRKSYAARRRILDEMQLHGPRWQTPEAFDDGPVLWNAICEHELEGVVVKRRSSRSQLRGFPPIVLTVRP